MQPWEIIGIAWELGYLIALPLVGFAFLGHLADKAMGSSPLFLLIGVIAAIFISSVLVYRKTMDLLRRTENASKKDNDDHSQTPS